MKIQRHIGLPEGDMAIILDNQTLLHNIVTSELKQKDEEINRLNNIILKIDQYLIDCGVDDEILKSCGIFDVNGVELRKYIIELKEGIK